MAPAIILVFIAISSLQPLYLIDEIHNSVLTLTCHCIKLPFQSELWTIYLGMKQLACEAYYIPTVLSLTVCVQLYLHCLMSVWGVLFNPLSMVPPSPSPKPYHSRG
jgi:hypothetical protein